MVIMDFLKYLSRAALLVVLFLVSCDSRPITQGAGNTAEDWQIPKALDSTWAELKQLKGNYGKLLPVGEELQRALTRSEGWSSDRSVQGHLPIVLHPAGYTVYFALEEDLVYFGLLMVVLDWG